MMFNSIPHDVFKDWRILVVDDEPNGREVVRILLSHYGATIFVANNGDEGVTLARAVLPRFIISDLSMPVMDGWEMLRCLKADPITSRIPVIALTAHAMSGDRERVMLAGFTNYLTKPITPSRFMYYLLHVLSEIPEFAVQLS